MNEEHLKKQLVRVTIVVVVIGIMLCALIGGVWGYLYRTANESDYIQMQMDGREYRENILKQMDKTLQILTTLSKAYEVSDILSRPDDLKINIVETNKANAFISLAYFTPDGKCLLNTLGSDSISEYSIDFFHEFLQDSVSKSFEGKNSVSKIYDSRLYDGKVFVYSVPVRRNGEVVGVLAASNTIDIFSDIVNTNMSTRGGSCVQMINTQGEILVRSNNNIVDESVKNVFEDKYLTDRIKKKTETALSSNESVFGEGRYNGSKCHFYVEPIGMNNWYLFCVNKVSESVLPWESTVLITGGLLLLILLITISIISIGYFKFRKNTIYLIKKAYFDPITGVMNVLKFDQEYEEYIKSNSDYSVVALNIHNFKFINDLFRTAGGNDVLRYVKRVIEDNLKEGEFFCRDSADQFYILIKETDECEIARRMNEIIKYVSDSTLHAEYSYEISLYTGVAIKGDREKALLAIQSIKTKLYETVAFYNKDLHEKLRKKNDIERYMHRALQNNEFKLFLQPKYSLKTNELIGAEALVRWQMSDGTYKFPNEFIPIFEANGFCLKLDMYMLEKACEQLRAWIDCGVKPVPISVNQSRLLFFNGNYVNDLMQVLNKYDIPASMITLEILENVTIDNLDEVSSQINELHSKGFRISMDDFGSGYSSLNMLYKLNIDELKLDRGFLMESGKTDTRRNIILENIILIAKKLGISTVAEGIETQNDNDIMAKLGCDYGQGYFYSRPISSEEFSKKYMKK